MSLSPSPSEPSQPLGRGWRIALVLSLALNFLFIGVVVGGLWRHWQAEGWGERNLLSLLWKSLPAEDRQRARTASDHDGSGAEPQDLEEPSRQRARLVAEHARLRALLTTEPFDRAAFEEELRAYRARALERSDRALARLVDRVAAMSLAERAALANRLERHLRRIANR